MFLERLTCGLQFFSTQCPWLCSCDSYLQILALFMPQIRAAFRVLALSHPALNAKYQVQLSAAEVFLATPYCPGIRAMPHCDFKQMLFFDPVLSHFNLSLGICRVTLICVPTFDPPCSSSVFILNTEKLRLSFI